MKIKRTCRRCGYVWYGSVAGGIAAGILKSFFAGLVTAKTGGSYIDHAKFRDELRLCPNCGASDSYKTEYEKEEPKPAPAPKKIPEQKTTKPEPKKTEVAPEKKPEPSRSDTILGCLIIIVMIVAVICIGRCACSGPSETSSGMNENIEENKEQRAKADSLQNEESYVLGKKLFDEKKYDEALPILGKINDKHKNYGEVKDMITFADEYIKAGALSLLLGNYVYAKDGLNVSGTASKEFQSILNAASDKLLVLQNVVINFGKITILIDSCKQIQKYELKYLKPQERNNVKATSNKLITQAKNKLKNEQLRDFPILRKEFANMFSKMNSELQVVARAKGNRNTTLEFVGTFFVNEANIDTHHKMLISSGMIDKAITFFRFKRILYKWYENDNGFYYTYNTYADDFEVNKNTTGEIKK